jgi:uncharacterized membrane protein YagU involved in acid resistance
MAVSLSRVALVQPACLLGRRPRALAIGCKSALSHGEHGDLWHGRDGKSTSMSLFDTPRFPIMGKRVLELSAKNARRAARPTIAQTKEEHLLMRNMLIKLAAGAVGGAVATLLMQKTVPLARKLPEKLQPQMPSQDPGHFIVQQGEKIVGPLSQKMHSAAAHVLPWAYGISWPLGLAALSGLLGLRSTGKTIAAGAALGAIVWLVGYEGWLPALDLAPPAHRVPLAKNASGLLSHVAYGALASVPLAIAAPRVSA